MPRKPPLQERIVDTAVELADEVGRPAVRLHRVAAHLGVSPLETRLHYPDLDAVANAWLAGECLARADDAMLAVAERADLVDAPPPDRSEAALTAWFTALGGRQRMLRSILSYKLNAWLARADDAMLAVAERADLVDAPPPDRSEAALTAWFTALGGRQRMLRSILSYKLKPSHIHLQAALVVATSRRVQWLREAARLDAMGGQKSVEEAGLTLLFVATVLRWLNDSSENFERTRAFIAHWRERADGLMVSWAMAKLLP